jgi:hypothetical protein
MSVAASLVHWHQISPGYRVRQSLLAAWGRTPVAPLWPLGLDGSYLSPARLRNLERLSNRTTSIPGCYMECGVAEGGSALLLGLLARRRNRPLWLFDTFEGLPAPSENDPDFDAAMQWTGRCRGELHEIEAKLERFGLWDRTTAVKGLFQDTMPDLDIPPIALVHLDGDWYDSTMTCLTHLWPKVSPGGYVQFDDYFRWEGCRKAVDEYFGGRVALHRIDDIGAWAQKPR